MNSWGVRGAVAAVGVAIVVGGLGGAAVYAATGSSVGVVGGGHGPFGPPPHGGPPPRPGASAADEEPVVHGETVVATGDGKFRTELTQTGVITVMAPDSLTARSADGFTQVYTIPAVATMPPFAPGDEVTVRATRSGSQAVVTTVRPPQQH